MQWMEVVGIDLSKINPVFFWLNRCVWRRTWREKTSSAVSEVVQLTSGGLSGSVAIRVPNLRVRRQGNRILIGQDLEQVAVVPAGLLAPGGDAALGRGLPA